MSDRAKLLQLRALAVSARNAAAAPDYDEQAIREALWALVDTALDTGEPQGSSLSTASDPAGGVSPLNLDRLATAGQRIRAFVEDMPDPNEMVDELYSLAAAVDAGLARVRALEAVTQAARAFADNAMCLDAECGNKICVLNRALAVVDGGGTESE